MITILSGSPRKNSNTMRVAKAMKSAIAAEDHTQTVKIVDFNGFDIPSANQGIMKMEHLTPWQTELYESMRDASMIFVLTPEYNWFPSAEIIQTIHALGGSSYSAAWQNKVFATAGVSNGRGGRMPAVQLTYAINKLINVFDFESVVSAKIFESQFTPSVLDEAGISLGNIDYDKGLKAFVSYNLRLNKRMSE